VVRISAWPSKTWMVRRSVPASSMWVAQAWRLCRMRHRRHYAASRTMPRVGAHAAIHIGLSLPMRHSSAPCLALWESDKPTLHLLKHD
jgi:hypothetical protein